MTAPHIAQIMKPALFDAIKAEALELLPYLNELWNKEVVSGSAQKTAKPMAYYNNKPGSTINHAAIETAAKFFHRWLTNKRTILREGLIAMSDGGVFYRAEVTVRLSEAFAAHCGGDEALMVAAALARGVLPLSLLLPLQVLLALCLIFPDLFSSSSSSSSGLRNLRVPRPPPQSWYRDLEWCR